MNLCYADTKNSAGAIVQQKVAPDGPVVITIAPTDKTFTATGCQDFVKQ
jgi:hypothetical protein